MEELDEGGPHGEEGAVDSSFTHSSFTPPRACCVGMGGEGEREAAAEKDGVGVGTAGVAVGAAGLPR